MRNIMTGSPYGNVNYDELTVVRMGIFGCFWFFFSMLTYGAAVPSGVFLSAMFVGCSVGQIYEDIRVNLFGIENTVYSSLPLVLGAASMMSSYTRLSYSIVVLMLETTNSFNLAIPMIVAVFTTRTVADWFNNGLFDREIRNL